MLRPPLDGGVVLITGASSGIGRELARELAPRAAGLVLVARRAERLTALQSELVATHPDLRVHVQACDVGDLRALDAMLAAVQKEAGDIDVLINNAGLGDFGMFDRAEWPKLEQMIALNVTALTYLTHRLLGPMVARRRGGILNVSSGFGLEFFPGFAAYVGTKHFVTGFTESLRTELREYGVVVSQLCPGPVATEFNDLSGGALVLKKPPAEISAPRCARWAVTGFARGRALIVPGILMNLVTFIGSISPRVLKRALYGLVARRLRADHERALAGRREPEKALPPAGSE